MLNYNPQLFSKQVHSAKRFFKNIEEENDNKSITIAAGGREFCSAHYKIDRKTFPYYNIEFVASGLGHLNLSGKNFKLSPGTIFTYGPNIKHTIKSNKKSPLIKYFIAFFGEKAKKLLKKQKLLGEVYHTASPNWILHTFEELIEYGLHKSTYSDVISSHLLEILCYKIIDSALSHGETAARSFITYQKCIHTINSNYLKYTTLKDLAKANCINTSYLCRLFNRYDHQSPYKHLMMLKMNHAANLLLEKGTQIKEVSFKMGFTDRYHFSRCFKNYMGLPPRTFQNLNWK